MNMTIQDLDRCQDTWGGLHYLLVHLTLVSPKINWCSFKAINCVFWSFEIQRTLLQVENNTVNTCENTVEGKGVEIVFHRRTQAIWTHAVHMH